jgi:AraC-like DNA-binding protein
MAAYLHLPEPAFFRMTMRKRGQLAVTRVRSEIPMPERSVQIPSESAFVVDVCLRPLAPAWLWKRGRAVDVDPIRRDGSVSVVNLEDEASFYFGSAFDILQIYIPHASLNEFADDHGARRCGKLTWPHGRVDPILKNLSHSILQAIEHPVAACSLYLDHALQAIHAYIACTYGGMKIEPQTMRGGLARWQIKRATEVMTAQLDAHVSLSRVARECQLSVSHFVRAFKHSLGQTPYRWLMERRIETAKELLLRSQLPQADIALRCGFADQACFIRSFRCKVNSTPGEWRSSHAEGSFNAVPANGA